MGLQGDMIGWHGGSLAEFLVTRGSLEDNGVTGGQPREEGVTGGSLGEYGNGGAVWTLHGLKKVGGFPQLITE